MSVRIGCYAEENSGDCVFLVLAVVLYFVYQHYQLPEGFANYGKEDSGSGIGGVAQGKDLWVNTAPVGQFPANHFGLKDMQGNVLEWVQDCWHDYSGDQTDGVAQVSGGCDLRILRGGSWKLPAIFLISSVRPRNSPNQRNDEIGFRVVCPYPISSR